MTDPARSDRYPPEIEAMPDRQAEYEVISPYGTCFICKRDCDVTSINVDFGVFGIAPVCGICQDTADGLMGDDQDEDERPNREGLPEFNGAFKSW